MGNLIVGNITVIIIHSLGTTLHPPMHTWDVPLGPAPCYPFVTAAAFRPTNACLASNSNGLSTFYTVVFACGLLISIRRRAAVRHVARLACHISFTSSMVCACDAEPKLLRSDQWGWPNRSMWARSRAAAIWREGRSVGGGTCVWGAAR